MRAIAAVVCMSLLTGCFPHNQKAQTYSKWAEGASLVAGVAIEGVINSGADCDAMAGPGTDASGCHTKASALGTVGVVLILGGLLGFVATVSTSEDAPKPVTIKEEKPATATAAGTFRAPPGANAASAQTASPTTGSAAAPKSAP